MLLKNARENCESSASLSLSMLFVSRKIEERPVCTDNKRNLYDLARYIRLAGYIRWNFENLSTVSISFGASLDICALDSIVRSYKLTHSLLINLFNYSRFW